MSREASLVGEARRLGATMLPAYGQSGEGG